MVDLNWFHNYNYKHANALKKFMNSVASYNMVLWRLQKLE